MDEGSKNEENEREELSMKEAKKDTNVDKDENIKTEKQRGERIHEENLKKKKEKEDYRTIKTQTEISQENAPKKKNLKKET